MSDFLKLELRNQSSLVEEQEVLNTTESFPASVLFCCFVFETGFLVVALAILELTPKTRLTLNREIRLPLPLKCWN